MAGLILPQRELLSQYETTQHTPPTPILETISTKTEHSNAADAEAALLKRYTIPPNTNTIPHPSDTPYSQFATSIETASPVLIRRIPKAPENLATSIRRSIDLLWEIPHPIIPPIHEWLDTPTHLYLITSNPPRRSLRELITSDQAGKPVPPDGLKDVMTQLFSGIAHLFLHHIAPMRVTADNMLFDAQSGLVLSGFEDHAVRYSEEKVRGMPYASVSGRFGEDIWTAPEVWEAEREGMCYNARKAVVWSCGVVLYYMVTGQTTRLADLCHPSTQHENTTPVKRRYSAATKISKDLPKIINYPSRLRVPSWAINIISRMLLFDPNRRPELIEVAAKVPKMPGDPRQRPLMEIAYLDYKYNVGPVGPPVEELLNGEGEGDDGRSSILGGGGAGSIFSVSSRTGLLGRRLSGR